MTITPNQIRAGRALLDWNQDDLAKATDLARPTIVNIESGSQTPGEKTINKIIKAFDRNRIEFTHDEGVRRKSKATRIFRGGEKGLKFFDFVLKHMQENLGSLYISNIFSDDYKRCWPGFYDQEYVKGLKALGDKIDLRRLRYGWDENHPDLSHGQMKMLPDMDMSSSITFYVFGNYVAILLFLDEPVILLIESEEAAETYREKFLIQWETAIIPKYERNKR